MLRWKLKEKPRITLLFKRKIRIWETNIAEKENLNGDNKRKQY